MNVRRYMEAAAKIGNDGGPLFRPCENRAECSHVEAEGQSFKVGRCWSTPG